MHHYIGVPVNNDPLKCVYGECRNFSINCCVTRNLNVYLEKAQVIGSTTIGVHAIRPLGNQFGDAGPDDVCKKFFGVPKEEEIWITDALHEKSSQRSKATMESNPFDHNSIPEQCKDHPRRQFKYMTDAMRYARKDYVSTGAILQKAALGNVICQAFHSGKGRMLNLTPDRRGTIRSSMYYTTLKVSSRMEAADWDKVQHVQTDLVRQQLAPEGYMGAYCLPTMSSCYQPKYQDGEYVSDSDED
ncbi:hypothetical protein K492DRAFT_200088 [Lichtheimia hyalospora FSU 10163]|nr:hypothetical protein K492DRAFT_200088 [Lichtheimia hyalospora FSU 10163]